jgi:transcriptional regulator with XRE-family HTH domain
VTMGERIKHLRWKKHISQRALARFLGYSEAMICYWENDVESPNWSGLCNLASFFDMTLSGLLRGVDKD